MTAQAKIRLLLTGGTIDKDYNTLNGQLSFDQTHLNQLLAEANITLDIELQSLMLKDSLEMTEQDREQIAKACLESNEQHIVITHGTDTMADTAQYLLNQFSKTPDLADKTIVLTGAMRPYCLGRSDAAFNMGSALMAVQLQNAGVYISMNGQLFDGNNVTKDRKLGQFIPTPA